MKTLTPIFEEHDEDRYGTFTRRDLIRLLFKHKGIIFASFAAVTAIVVSVLWYLPATYEFSGRVLVMIEQEGRPNFFTGVAAYLARRDTDPVQRKIETEMELVDSRAIAAQVVRRLNLHYSEVYHKPYVHLMDLAERYLGPALEGLGVLKSPQKRGFDDTVDALIKSITVEPVKSKSANTNSNIIKVTLRSPDPQLGRRELDALLEAYTRFQPALQQTAGQRAQTLVRNNMDESYQQVLKAQKRLRTFLANHGPVAGSGMTGGILPNPAALSVGADLGPSSARKRGGQKQDGFRYDEQSVLTSPGDETAVSMMKTRLVAMELKLLDMQQDFGHDNEAVNKLKKSIALLKPRLKKEMDAYAADQITQISLERDLHADENKYLELKKRLSQIQLFLEMNAGQAGNRVVVASPVTPDSSDWKKRVLVGSLGSVGGLFLGFLLAGIREYSDHLLDSKERVQRSLHMPVLATIPMMGRGNRAKVLDPKTVREL